MQTPQYPSSSGRLFLKDIQEDQKHIDLLRFQRSKMTLLSREHRILKVDNARLQQENAGLKEAFDQLSTTTQRLDSETKRLIYDLRS